LPVVPSARPIWDIRRLTADEVEAVGSVLGLARLHQGDGFYLVAWQGDQPAGHAYLALTDPPEMQDVEVRPGFRRRGAASALAAAVEAEAGRRGQSVLRITVSAGSEAAQALYHGLGYADTGLSPVRVKGVIQIRTGPLDVDDTLLTWEKPIRVPWV
jgi:ribosomal protein S18 acetylase RimI-like enzyme